MKDIFKTRSTNGRRGLGVVSEAEEVKFPAEGRVELLGTVSGIETYRFIPAPGLGQWIHIMEDVKIHGGATLIKGMDLQSYRSVTLLALGPEAVVEEFAYKRRSSEVCAFINGEKKNLSETVLLAMGLLNLSDEQLERVKSFSYNPPEKLNSQLADALAKWKEQQK